MGQLLTNLLGQLLGTRNEEVPICNLKRELRVSNEQVTDLQRQLSASNEKVTSLERELTMRDEQATKLQRRHLAKKEKVTDLQRQLSASNEKVTSLERELTMRDEQATKLQIRRLAMKENVTDLQRELSARNEQVTDLERELTARNKQVTNLQRKLSARNKQVTDLERELTARNKQVTDLERELTTRKEHVTDLERELIARIEQVTYLERELTASNKQVTDLQRELTTRKEHVTDLERELIARIEQVTYLERELTARNRQVTNLERNLDQLRELGTTCTLDGANSSENVTEMKRDWKINRNEIVTIPGKVLGRGAWGRVTQGKFRRSNVAVKEIHKAILSPHNRMAFEREVKIASRCRHPCLLQFIGATNDEEGVLLVTELMDRSLRSLYQKRPLTEREISVISLDVAQALNYLHQNKPDPIIHRDISSSNVLLWRQGRHWRGKVSDYGTANFVRQCGIDSTGAAIYCPPETLSGAQDQIISCKVDVYSFGVLLCEMYIRELPDPQQRDTQISRMVLCRFQEIVKRCVQTEPGERPNMEEIIDSLEE